MTSLTKALVVALPVVLVAACGSDRSAQTASTTTVARPMATTMEPTVQRTDQTMYQRSLRK